MKPLLQISVAFVCFSFLQNLTPGSAAQTTTSPTKSDGSRLQDAAPAEKPPPIAQLPVAPTDAVITIHGRCAESHEVASDKQRACDTVINKGEFERLINAVDFGKQAIQADARKSFAQTYADLLLFESASNDAGLQDTPEFHEILRWLSLRALADVYYHRIQEKYRVPQEAEIDAYYKKHLSSFETVRLTRIFIPTDDYSVLDKEAFAKKAEEQATIARERAAKADDPDRIQKDVYVALGLSNAPATDMGTKRRADLLASEADDIFRLAPGEFSQIEKEPRSYVIYKVVSKSTPRQDEVKGEISKKLTRENIDAALQAVRSSGKVDFNPSYFGPTAPKSPQSASQGSQPSANDR